MKRQQNSTELTPEMADALKRCFDAYGADRAKWPTAMREQFCDINNDSELKRVGGEAAALDAYLDAATTPQISVDFKNRILASYTAPQPSSLGASLHKLFDGRQLLPVGAAASLGVCVGALGLATGLLTANIQAAYPPEYEAYAYLEQSVIAYDEEEAAVWVED